MCGISGIISFENIDAEKISVLKSINNALSHRGPDAGDIYDDANVVLGHRRLSIIDVSDEANQPMHCAEEKISIVFNGEIYNYATLRAELEKEYQFKTSHSDTEVILNAYKKWGIECLKYFKGMFAFCLYDREKHKTFLVRDRLGKKPLYYHKNGKCFYFSSEINSLFQSNVLSKEINDEAIYHYLTFLTIPQPATFFNGVHKVKAGHYIEIDNKNVCKETCYWQLSSFYESKSTSFSYDTIVEKSTEYIETSMQRRFVSDVPIALALSGGFDSSLNAYYAAKMGIDVTTINLAYAVKSTDDESIIAEKYAKELGLPYHQLEIDDTIFASTIQEYLEIQKDMPIGDPNFCLLYFIAKYTKNKGNKVLIVGEGGDEIGGYPIYDKIHQEYNTIQNIPLARYFLSWSSRFIDKTDIFYNDKLISRRHIHAFKERIKQSFWQKELPTQSTYEYLANLMQQVSSKDIRDKINYVDYAMRLPDLILPRVDYPTMAAGVEARSPFLDTEWIEFNNSLSFNQKMKVGTKSILKSIAKDKLPDYILNHKKVGFGMLLKPFLNTTLPKWFEDEIVNERNAPIKAYIHGDFLNEICVKHKQTKKMGYRMWVLYSLNSWLKQHV